MAHQRILEIGPRVEEDVLSALRTSGNYDDPDERQIAFQEISFLEDELPSLELYASALILYGVFEATSSRLLDFLSKQGVEADLRAAKGANYVQRWFRSK